MGIDIEKTLTAYKILALVKGAITYVIPILALLIFWLMNTKLENISYELSKIKKILENKEDLK